MVDEKVEMDGVLSLEGPILESIFGTYLLLKNYSVIPRNESYGIEHDALVLDFDDKYIIYECTGQENITPEKLDDFYERTITLHERLKKMENKEIKKAIFISAVNDDSWNEKSKNAKLDIEKNLKKVNINFEVLGGLQLIKELLKSGALGIRVDFNRIYLCGLDDLGIRYDPNEKLFKLKNLEMINNDLYKFRKTQYSFFPSHYWELHYHQEIKGALEEEYKLKGEPLSIWTYPYYEGLKWKGLNDFIMLEREFLESLDHFILKVEDNIIFSVRSSRKHDYYRLNMFFVDEILDKKKTQSILGKAVRIVNSLKPEYNINEEKIFVNIFSTSEIWTSGGWNQVNYALPETFKQDIIGIDIKRGNDIIIDLLNRNILGFKFKQKNQLTLSSDNIETIKLKDLQN